MSKTKSPIFILLLSGLTFFFVLSDKIAIAEDISLPKPRYKGTLSVEEALKARRTHRSFSSRSLTLKQFSQILWGSYGVTARKYGSFLKTAPSAGALYPLDIYAVVGKESVENIAPGVYHYNPEDHRADLLRVGDLRTEVARQSFHQAWMAKAPLMLVVTGQYERSSIKYGPRGLIYTHIEAGCVGQNIFLQAEAIGLKAGIVGAFNNTDVVKTMGLPASHDPLLIMPVGFSSD
ncbi:MAG: SagB/ThcOx family dehydrogenase [Deltaproteobacteria bacterium]|nr:SagB/ThcOx family dehydrogenase [Deltaproteobacteria bacterium]